VDKTPEFFTTKTPIEHPAYRQAGKKEHLPNERQAKKKTAIH
jgi:hypothetical protein